MFSTSSKTSQSHASKVPHVNPNLSIEGFDYANEDYIAIVRLMHHLRRVPIDSSLKKVFVV